jgi:hypothetical protein
MWCANRLDFGGAECVGSRFHVLRARIRFRRYRGHQVPFSCFPLPDMFLGVPRASGRFFTFYASSLVFKGTEAVGARFHVLSAPTRFRRYQGRRVPFSCFARPNSFSTVPMASGPIFIFYAPGLVFDGTEGVGSRFHVVPSQTGFRRFLGRRVPFSSFARPD